MSLPLLYSFRRCPYAMRARLALWVSGTRCELREVVLRDKPPSLLEYSPKATVPVLVLDSGEVIDESLDVMLWALRRNDPQGWLHPSVGNMEAMLSLIEHNDTEFKHHLDRYKYADRYGDVDPAFHRAEAERFLIRIEERLSEHPALFGSTLSLADAAVGPFIRQFANTNRQWFDESPYPKLKDWLERFIQSPLFVSVMGKYPQWHSGDDPTEVPEDLVSA